MIFVDSAVGSNELEGPLKQMGLPVEKTHLESGDLMWEGLGAGGSSALVGVEVKKIGELIGALRSNRLQGDQLPKMQRTFTPGCCWLVIEGQWKHDDRGLVVTYQGKGRGWTPLHGRMTAVELEKQLLTLEMLGGLHVRYTNTRRDTLRCLGALYRWWSDTALDRHTSHVAIYHPAPLIPISQFRQTISTLPGVGLKVSKAVERHFGGSLRLAFEATSHEWETITTTDDAGRQRVFGPKNAARVLAAIQDRGRYGR